MGIAERYVLKYGRQDVARDVWMAIPRLSQSWCCECHVQLSNAQQLVLMRQFEAAEWYLEG